MLSWPTWLLLLPRRLGVAMNHEVAGGCGTCRLGGGRMGVVVSVSGRLWWPPDLMNCLPLPYWMSPSSEIQIHVLTSYRVPYVL